MNTSHAHKTHKLPSNSLGPIEYVAIDQIKIGERQLRRRRRDVVEKIKRSVQEFGLNLPVLLDGDGTLLVGHGILEALKLLGWTEVPIIRIQHLTPAQAKAFSIAANRLGEISTWNTDQLGELFADWSLNEPDFALELTGFAVAEIDGFIENRKSKQQLEQRGAEPEAPNLASTAVTKLGDVWKLGRHRIVCGDATKYQTYQFLMSGDRAKIAFTDPPYNVAIDGHVTGNGATTHREFAMASGEMTSSEFVLFLRSVVSNMIDHSVDGSIHYICMDWRHLSELLQAGQLYTEFKNLCVWVKSNAGMGSFYRSQHELVLVFKNGRAPHRNNIELGRNGRFRSNVWHAPGANSFGRQTEEGNLLALHPTVKPIQLIADAILDSSARGDIVLDPFLGKDRKITVVESEARTVRHIFKRYLELGSINALLTDLKRTGTKTKLRQLSTGKSIGGIPFGRGTLGHLLRNRFYIGEVKYKDEVLRGEQRPVVDRKLFDAVQRKLAEQRSAQTTARTAWPHSSRDRPSIRDKGGRRRNDAQDSRTDDE